MALTLVGGYGLEAGGEAHGLGLLGEDGFLGTIARTASPSWVVVRGDRVYAVDEPGGTVSSWRRTATGLELDRQVAAGGEIPCHLTVTDDAVYAACYGDGVLARVPLDEDGAVAGDGEVVVRGDGRGPHPDQGRARVHASAWHGDTLLATDLGSDEVHALAVGGTRAGTGESWALTAGTGPRDLVVLDDGRVLVLGELSCHLLVLSPTGRVMHDVPLPGAQDGDHAAALAVLPREGGGGAGGVRVITGLRGSDLVSAVDVPDDAPPRPVGSAPCGGEWPRHLVLVGDALLVANQNSSSVTVIDPETLELIGGPFAVPSPSCLVPVGDDWATTLL